MQNKPDIFDRIMGLPPLQRLYPLYQKHKSVLLYIFFGGLTTVISIGSFILFDSVLKIEPLISNFFSWVLAVAFAYVTNRIWVFSSRSGGMGIVKEILSFFGGRALTLGFEELVLWLFVHLLHFNSTVIKIAGQLAVLILNYVISKLLVFRTNQSA